MRFSSAGLLSVTLLTSQLAAAGSPPSSPQQLGAVQAAIDFCSNLAPASAKRIENEGKTTLPDMTAARVAANRHDAEFQKTYQVIASVLKLLDRSDADRICGVPSGNRPKPAHRAAP